MTARAELLESLPVLTRYYGITPSDIETMTRREIDEYIRQMNKAVKDAERASRG